MRAVLVSKAQVFVAVVRVAGRSSGSPGSPLIISDCARSNHPRRSQRAAPHFDGSRVVVTWLTATTRDGTP